jgi:drug/metabolite transporter (DMT)-like permease
MKHQHHTTLGFLAALLAVMLWSGNFIVARGIAGAVPPVQLSLLRWITAGIIILPVTFCIIIEQWKLIKQHIVYLSITAFIGISLFNTFLYVGGHFTPAINLAIIGTSASPIFATILAAIFLKEKVHFFKLTGMLLCFIGVIFLITKGNWLHLQQFNFSKGDIWVLMSALLFAIYTILVKKKPIALNGNAFLAVIISLGSLFLVPLLWVQNFFWQQPTTLNMHIFWIMIYLGAGASVLAYLSWNKAVLELGASKTALMGNLIPLFSTIEAVLLLNEKFYKVHVISSILIILGLFLANFLSIKSFTFKKKQI